MFFPLNCLWVSFGNRYFEDFQCLRNLTQKKPEEWTIFLHTRTFFAYIQVSSFASPILCLNGLFSNSSNSSIFPSVCTSVLHFSHTFALCPQKGKRPWQGMTHSVPCLTPNLQTDLRLILHISAVTKDSKGLWSHNALCDSGEMIKF